jgi:hypothetical protein
MKDTRKWARLLVCLAFHMIFTGLAGAIFVDILGIARPGKILFLPSLIAAGIVGIFYTWDREGGRIAEAGNFAAALTALRLWSDFTYSPSSSILWAHIAAWPVWTSYLSNILIILGAGWYTERRRGS